MSHSDPRHGKFHSLLTRTLLALVVGAAILPDAVEAGDGGKQGMGSIPAIAEREIARRQQQVEEAMGFVEVGDNLMAQGDACAAVEEYRQALDRIPTAMATEAVRRDTASRFGKAAVLCARQYADNGEIEKARELLEETLLPTRDPSNRNARVLLSWLDDEIRFTPANTPDHSRRVNEVERLLTLGESHYLLGNYDEAEKQLNTALTFDPYNKAARGFLEQIERARIDYYGSAYNHTRARMLRMVDEKWETQPPLATAFIDEIQGGGGDQGTDLRAINSSKLKSIIIPRVNFQGTTLAEAIEFLRVNSVRYDRTPGIPPEERGVSINIREPRTIDENSPSFGEKTVEELILDNAPLGEVLRYLGEMTGMRVKIDQYAVFLVPLSESDTDLYTRSFRVPPNFIPPAGEGGTSPIASDPFAQPEDTGPSFQRLSAQEYLESRGVPFPDGSSANYDPRTSTLTVRNSTQAMELVDTIVDEAIRSQPKGVDIQTKFVEVEQRNTNELGFDWLLGPGVINDGNGVLIAGGTAGNGTQTLAADYAIIDPLTTGFGNTALPVGRNPVTAGTRSGDFAITRNAIDSLLNTNIADVGDDQVAPGALSIAGIFTEPQFQVIMRAVDQKKGTDLLSAPSVTTKSGLPARIEVIREFIYPTEYDPPELPGEVGLLGGFLDENAFDPNEGVEQVAGFPVTPATPTAFDTRNLGVTLEVEPVVSPDGYTIELSLMPEIIEFEGFINYGNPITAPTVDPLGRPTNVVITENRIVMPIFATRRVKTQVTAYDGATVGLGGLIREDVQDIEDKVPIFGDLPIVGRFFKSMTEDRFKRNLMVFVTAELIDPSGKLIRDTSADSASNASPVTPAAPPAADDLPTLD